MTREAEGVGDPAEGVDSAKCALERIERELRRQVENGRPIEPYMVREMHEWTLDGLRNVTTPADAAHPAQADLSHTPEQSRMVAWYTKRLAADGQTCGWGLEKRGEDFVATYAQIAWDAWLEAQRLTTPPAESGKCATCGGKGYLFTEECPYCAAESGGV